MDSSKEEQKPVRTAESALLTCIIETAAAMITRIPLLLRNYKRVLFQQGIFDKVLEDHRFWENDMLARLIEFRSTWRCLEDKLDFKRDAVAARFETQMHGIKYGNKPVRDAVLDLICEGQEILLERGRIRFSDRDSLWILLNELLIHEEYYFRPATDVPTILDGGCHFGLATVYFKTLFPRAKVLAFEPIPHIRQMAQSNFDSIGLPDVTLLPYALSDQEGKSVFYVPESRPMASSLINRLEGREKTIVKYEVDCKRLSDYLREPVHFLKLDIEGTEYRVIREIREHLDKVQYLFCECHKVDDNSDQDMAELLNILSQAGFDYRCTNSWTTQMRTAFRPMNFVNEPLSNIVFARNRDWKN